MVLPFCVVDDKDSSGAYATRGAWQSKLRQRASSRPRSAAASGVLRTGAELLLDSFERASEQCCDLRAGALPGAFACPREAGLGTTGAQRRIVEQARDGVRESVQGKR